MEFHPAVRIGAAVRIEDYTEQCAYVVRAQLPGLDSEKDVEVTVEGGVLTIHAERREEAHRLEFRYGSLTRSVALPGGADPDKSTASYDRGILEVRVPVNRAEGAEPADSNRAAGITVPYCRCLARRA